MIKFTGFAAALLIAALPGLFSAPAWADTLNEQTIAKLESQGQSPVDGYETEDGTHYIITNGETGDCGKLYIISLSTGEFTEKYDFSKNKDVTGCNPVSVDISSVVNPPLVVVTTSDGHYDYFPDSAEGTIISSGVIPGDAVGTTTQPPSASRSRSSAAATPAYLYVTYSNSNASSDGAIYRAAVSSTGKLSKPSLIFAFPGGAGGAFPIAPAILGADGNLYGVTNGGGTTTPALCQPAKGVNGCGTVYRLSPVVGKTRWHEDVLYTFQGGKDGSQPNRRLAIDSTGNLYGTTFQGGDLTGKAAGHCVGAEFGVAFGCGTVFRLTKGAKIPWSESVLYAFHDSQDGAQPYGPVTLDAQGNVFGTTVAGGFINAAPCLSSALQGLTPGCGVAFELTHSAGAGPWPETVLYTFKDGKDGAQPSGPLTFDKTGNIIGATLAGGDTTGACAFANGFGWAAGCGVVFKLKKPAAP